MRASTTIKHGLLGCAVLAIAACAKRSDLPGDTTLDATPFATPARSQEGMGPIESRLFTPDLIMENQGAIGVDAAQRDAILREVDRARGEMTRLEWDLNAEKEKLAAVLSPERVDEEKGTQAALRVLAMEDKLKSAHLTMLMRVKNLLRGEQQTKLQAIRRAAK